MTKHAKSSVTSNPSKSPLNNPSADTSQDDQNNIKALKSGICPDSSEYQEVYQKLFGSLPHAESIDKQEDHSSDYPEEPAITIHKIFDFEIAEKLSGRISIGKDERKFYSSLLHENAEKPLIEPTPQTFTRIEKLFEDFPNAKELLEFVQDFLYLRSISNKKPIYFPPVLISGAVGIGKTAVIKAICQALEIEYGFYDFSSASSSWGLCGQDSGWNGSHIGLVLKKLLYGSCGNPVLHLDELDKGLINHNLDPYLALYTLLERPQMRQYQDAFAQNLTVDASFISFFATANNVQLISPIVLSRFRVIELQPPSRQQMRHIAENMYRIKLHDEGVDHVFSTSLSPSVIDYLSDKTPREAGLILARGIAAASKRQPDFGILHELMLSDLSDCHALDVQERKMGFIW